MLFTDTYYFCVLCVLFYYSEKRYIIQNHHIYVPYSIF